MCGIAGVYHLDKQKADIRILAKMSKVLFHRGPDSHGEFIYNNIGLANRRLAIIDPTEDGNQPMGTKDGNLWITYNGEIFNFKNIRDELENKGYKFKSHSDTETLLYGYKEYGSEIINKLIGQFAFCIWDKKKDRLFLARDPLGINPLYYARIGKTFIFASEVKALLASGFIRKEIDPEALHHYLSMYMIPAPLTIFKEIKSLIPGFMMIVDKNGIKTRRFWDIPVGLWRDNKKTYKDLKDELKTRLISAVSSAQVSDVPVGAFLSGGIDSSTIVALMATNGKAKIKTYNLWAEGGVSYDEREYARLISKKFGTEHHECSVFERDIITELPKIIYFFDQPTGGSFENYFISKMAGRDVKVALSGLGGDELFAGYHSIIYKTKYLSSFYSHSPSYFRKLIMNLVKVLPLAVDIKKTIKIADKLLQCPGIMKKRLFLYFAFGEKEKKLIYNTNFLPKVKNYTTDIFFDKIFYKVKNQSEIDQLSYLDFKTYTRDDLLLGTGMMGMANSLEVRVPFLNQDLVSFSSQIPPKYKYYRGMSKYILKDVMKEWLPEKILRHRKTGFGLPRVGYMKTILKPYILKVLSSDSIKKRGFFNLVHLKTVIEQFYSEKSNKMLWNEHLRVWLFFVFELWCRIYLDEKEVEVPGVSLSDLCA